MTHIKRPPKGVALKGPDSGYHYLTRHELRIGPFLIFGWFTAPRKYWKKFK